MKSGLSIVSPSQAGDLVDSVQLIVASLDSVDTPHIINPHRHIRGQLVYASHSSLRIMSMGTTFMLPSEFAAWIPPGVIHAVSAATPIEYCSLFVDDSVCDALPRDVQLLHLSSLLKELTKTAARADQLIPDARARLAAVIFDQMKLLRPACVALPIPTAVRFRPIVEHLLEHPAEQLDLATWASRLSISERSLTRQFKQETGLTLGQWLQHVRVIKAIECLESGRSVKATAYDVGFQQPSAFIAMFKRVTGHTPTDYLMK